MAENLHEYKLYRKQLGLLPEGDYQGRPLAHTKEAPGMRDGSASRKLWRKSWVFQHSINKLEPISGISVRFQTPRLWVDLTSMVAAISATRR